MERPPNEDIPLFSTRSLEGEYTAWALVWTRDYGAAARLDQIIVDDYGRCYITDTTLGRAYVRDYLGNEVNTAGYLYCTPVTLKDGLSHSQTGKYVLGWGGATWRVVDVWRYGVIVGNCDTFAALADSRGFDYFAISPSGKFVAIIVESVATGNDRYVMLFEGT